MLAAGRLIHRVEIQQLADPTAVDDHGQPADEWETLATVWAEVKEGGGKEQLLSDGVSADTTHVVTMRYYPGLNPRMRLLWGERVLNVGGATNPDGRRVEHRITCTEDVSVAEESG